MNLYIVENIELRKSQRIQNLKKRKENSSSTDVIEPTEEKHVQKIKMSRSTRNKLALQKKKQ